jgi:hypothetical protein
MPFGFEEDFALVQDGLAAPSAGCPPRRVRAPGGAESSRGSARIREIRGEHLAARPPWRTLVQVEAIDHESGEEVVEVRAVLEPVRSCAIPDST